MPPVTRRRAAAGDAAPSMAPLARQRRGRNATPARQPQPPQVEKEDECCVCLGPLSLKRDVTMKPCSHKYHDSCLRRWLETRDCPCSQTCPLCRSRADSIVDHTGADAPPTFPYGDSGEPTKTHLIIHEQPAKLQELLQQTETGLTRAGEFKVAARQEQKPAEYIADIVDEEQQLLRRRGRLRAMLKEVERGEWDAPEVVVINHQPNMNRAGPLFNFRIPVDGAPERVRRFMLPPLPRAVQDARGAVFDEEDSSDDDDLTVEAFVRRPNSLSARRWAPPADEPAAAAAPAVRQAARPRGGSAQARGADEGAEAPRRSSRLAALRRAAGDGEEPMQH